MVTQEAFEEWKDSPLTQAVLAMLFHYSVVAREEFQDRVWATGGYLNSQDQMALSRLQARSELAGEIADMDFETYEEFQREG